MTIIYVGAGQTYTTIQAGINAAAKGDTVYVKSGKYSLGTERIVSKSNIKLIGENAKTTTIYAGTSTGGSAGSKGTSNGWIYCEGLSNIEISGFNFASAAKGTSDGGHGDTRNCIVLRSCTNIKVHDCTVSKYVYNDFVRCAKCTNVEIYNCTGQSGHDFISLLSGTNNTKIYNCDISVQTNTGIRVDNSSNTEIRNNNFTGQAGTGWCLVELENTVTNCDIHHNIFHDYRGSSGNNVTQPVHAIAKNVTVRNNVMWNVGSIAMGTSSGNIVNPTDKVLANWQAKGYGIAVTESNSGAVPEEVVASPVEALTADFTANVTKGKAPLKVRFTASTKGNPTSYLWTFEPTTSSDYCSSQPVSAGHTFKKAGTYTISLTVKNKDGSKTVTKKNYITVTK